MRESSGVFAPTLSPSKPLNQEGPLSLPYVTCRCSLGLLWCKLPKAPWFGNRFLP